MKHTNRVKALLACNGRRNDREWQSRQKNIGDLLRADPAYRALMEAFRARMSQLRRPGLSDDAVHRLAANDVEALRLLDKMLEIEGSHQ